jgi:hypothetical protein
MVVKSSTYRTSHIVVKNSLFSNKYVKPCEALVFLGFPRFLVVILTKNLTSLLWFFSFCSCWHGLCAGIAYQVNTSNFSFGSVPCDFSLSFQ